MEIMKDYQHTNNIYAKDYQNLCETDNNLSEDLSFEEMCLLSSRERHKAYNHKVVIDNLTGKNYYTLFCVWCSAFNGGNGKDSPEMFSLFIKQENIKLSEVQRKFILENYFGYVYKWDTEKKEYKIYKQKGNK